MDSNGWLITLCKYNCKAPQSPNWLKFKKDIKTANKSNKNMSFLAKDKHKTIQ